MCFLFFYGWNREKSYDEGLELLEELDTTLTTGRGIETNDVVTNGLGERSGKKRKKRRKSGEK